MIRLLRFLPVLLLIFISCEMDGPLNPSENLNNIPVIDITIEHEEYLKLKNNRTLNSDVSCTVKYNGEKYPGLIRASGAGSRYYFKWSYRIELEEGNEIEGIREFNLSAQVEDPSMVRTLIANRLYEAAGFLSFKNFHTFLRINDKDEGLFCLIEVIKEDYFNKRYLPVNELFKLGFSSSFSFKSANHPEFVFSKQIPKDERFHSLIQFINAVDTSTAENAEISLGGFLDTDSYLRYHALTSIIGNIDAFTNNFYLYKKNSSSPFEIIPWDFDKSYYTNVDFVLVGENSIIKKMFTNRKLFDRYKDLSSEMLNNLINTNVIFSTIDSTAAAIENAYNMDDYLGRGGLDLRDEIEKLKNYILFRKENVLNGIESLEQDYFNR